MSYLMSDKGMEFATTQKDPPVDINLNKNYLTVVEGQWWEPNFELTFS